jgi:uncharacterized membrane protein YjgN (DUF898 family)
MIVIVLIIIGILAGSGVGADFAAIINQSGNAEEANRRGEELGREHWGLILGLGVFAYLSLIVVSLIAFAQYYVAMLREIAAKLTMAELRFGTTVTTGRMIGFALTNVLIYILTLGLGLPIVIHRALRFITDNIQVYGEIEGSEITHADLPRPRYGEGLLEAFDPGLF